MSQGMFTAVSGIRANQTRLNVISNNIANVNTLGFKSSMANFSTVFATTFTGGTPPNGVLGGTNPMQQGNGAMVSEIASNWGQGGAQFTGRNTDLLINGDGFFAVERVDTNTTNNTTDFYLTRAGNFTLDSTGNLVTSSGNRVRGTSQINGSNVNTLGRVNIPLEFNICKDIAPDGTTVLGTRLGSPGATVADFEAAIPGVLPGHYPAGWDPTAVPAVGSQRVELVQLRSFTVGTNGSITATYSNGDRITVRQNEATAAAAQAAGDPSLIRTEIIHQTYEQQTFASHNVTARDSGQIGQLGGALAVFTGGTTPALTNAMEGMQLQLQAATVTNNAGLLYEGNNNFLIGANSGETNFGVAGSGARGSISAGALESSNVDIAGEFSNMIISQRGLEAASRVIRTQSEVMQTIIQIV